MARSKKHGSSRLAWQLTNPNARRSQLLNDPDVLAAFSSQVMTCSECGTMRVEVPRSEVAPDVQAAVERAMPVEKFIYCPKCEQYSGLGGWNSF